MRRTTFTTLKITTVLLIVIALTALAFSLNVGARVYRLFYGVKAGVVLEEIPMERLLEKEVREKVRQMAGAIDQAPQNARFEQSTMEVTPEVVGIKVDIETTVAAVMQAAAEEKVALVVIRLEPEVTAAVFRSINTKIASYHTSGGGSAGRTDNLYMAAKYMHGTVLAPGDIFSFNHVTGPRTFERGYSMAPVVGGLGIGGGVCQVATTVYNVALIAEMEIVERHPHSIRVGYVPPGKDATVTNYIDFKFRNSTDKFVQIRSGAGGGSVWVELWSQ